MNKPIFYTDEEKLEYFSSVSKVDVGLYPHCTTFKVYEGADFLVYTYDDKKNLKLYSSLIVSGVQALNVEGLRVTLINKRSYSIFRVGDVPVNLGTYDIAAYIPYRCFLERTVKELPSGKIIEGITGGMICCMKSNPNYRVPGDTYMIPNHLAHSYFEDGEFEAAVNRT